MPPETHNATPAAPAPRPIPVVCRFLRTKQAFGTFDGAGLAPWQEGLSTTAAYWCLRTTEAFGPDDAVAHAQCCREGRTCFEGPRA